MAALHRKSKGLPEFVKRMIRKAEERAIPYGLPAAIAALIVAPRLIAAAY